MDTTIPEPGEDWAEIVHYGWDDFCCSEDCPADHSTLNSCSRCESYGRMATDEEQRIRDEEMQQFLRETRRPQSREAK